LLQGLFHSPNALGRLFNALSTAYEFKQAGEPVTVLFLGTGTRWSKPLKNSVRRL